MELQDKDGKDLTNDDKKKALLKIMRKRLNNEAGSANKNRPAAAPIQKNAVGATDGMEREETPDAATK